MSNVPKFGIDRKFVKNGLIIPYVTIIIPYVKFTNDYDIL